MPPEGGTAASAETAVRRPELAGPLGRLGDQGRELRPVGDGERDVVPAAAGGRPAVGLRGEVPVAEEPDVERGQLELLTAADVGPAEFLGDGNVDREGAHLD